MSITLKELSARLGVSASTISRALTGEDPKWPRTRARVERIRAVAAELGYAPNSLARSLRTKRHYTIGLILPDIMNDFYATAATRVQETLTGEGYRSILCVTGDDPAVEAAQRRMLHEERVAGIVAVPSPPVGRVTEAAMDDDRTTPVIELVRQSNRDAADAVLIDDADAARQGTQHLIACGHRRIAVLTGPPILSTSRQRLAGYRAALHEAAIPVDESLICPGPYRREAARTTTLRLLDVADRPTALVATSNELVVGVLQALALRGARVPEDLSVVGFGNPDWFALVQPPLTTMALPIEEMATVAVHRLLTRLRQDGASEAGATLPPVISHFQAQLIVRASTGAPHST